MGKRIRLTEKSRAKERRAVEDNIPYPGTVNQPGRQFKRHRQYDNWVEVVNHPLPDMRHEWEEDARNEIGFPIPKIASVRRAANQAVKLAVLLLGDKTDDRTIEAQARDFVRLGNKILSRALKRYADTESLYSQDEEDEQKSQEEDEVKESKKAQEEKEDEQKSQEEKEVKESKKAQEEKEEETEADEAEEVEKPKAQKEDEEEEKVSKKSKSNVAELDIELQAADDEKVEMDEEEEKVLSSLYSQDEEEEDEVTSQDEDDDDDEEEVTSQDEEEEEEEEVTSQDEDDDEEEEEKTSSKRQAVHAKKSKKGVKHLVAQPRFASGDLNIDEISKIWKDAPDVSNLFND